MPKFLCKSGACPQLLNAPGYCPKCQELAPPKYSDSDRRYEQFRRDPRYRKFISSKRWTDTAKSYLARHAICERCNRLLALSVHHIRPVLEVIDAEPDLLFAEENLMSVCTNCHNRLEALLRAKKK